MKTQYVLCCYREERFHTSVGVHQGCLFSPTLVNIFLEDILTQALDNNNGTISNGGANITNHRFSDGIDRTRVDKDDLTKFVQNLDTAATQFGMDMHADKTKIMTTIALYKEAGAEVGNSRPFQIHR